MRKNLIVFFLLFSSFCFSEQWLEYSFGKSSNIGIERNSFYEGLEYKLNLKKIETFAGIQINEYCFDTTLYFSIWPWLLEFENHSISFGFQNIYHYLYWTDYLKENDFIIKPYFALNTNENFKLLFSMGYGFKLSQIPELKDDVPYLKDNTIYSSLFLDKTWENGFELYLDCSSHDTYRYPLFVSPQWTFGTAWTFQNKIRLKADYEIRVCDMFTTRHYVDSKIFRSGVRFIFK